MLLSKCITLPKIFPNGFSTHEVFPLHGFSTSAKTPPGSKNAKQPGPPGEKPKLARLGKKRKIPDEVSGCWPLHRNVTDNTDVLEGPMKSPLSYQVRRELL